MKYMLEKALLCIDGLIWGALLLRQHAVFGLEQHAFLQIDFMVDVSSRTGVWCLHLSGTDKKVVAVWSGTFSALEAPAIWDYEKLLCLTQLGAVEQAEECVLKVSFSGQLGGLSGIQLPSLGLNSARCSPEIAMAFKFFHVKYHVRICSREQVEGFLNNIVMIFCPGVKEERKKKPIHVIY